MPKLHWSQTLPFSKKIHSMQMCWYGIIRMSLPVFFCRNICMTLDLTWLICSKQRENVCFCATPPKIYLARRDNGLYCDVKEACIYKKKQRRGGCWSWRTLIRLFLSFPIHTLYQWHSSSSAFVRDRDQIDFHTLSQHLQVRECEDGKAWIASQTLT